MATTSSGIHLTNLASNNTFRNLEIFDNGQANLSETTGVWRSDLPGVSVSGSDNLFERDLIHDNGQDAFQSNGGLHNVTVRQSWLYNLRPHPSNPSLAFNYCMHSDGMQVYNGAVQTGVNFDSGILGPGLMQGAILGKHRRTETGQKWMTYVPGRAGPGYHQRQHNGLSDGAISQLDHTKRYLFPCGL